MSIPLRPTRSQFYTTLLFFISFFFFSNRRRHTSFDCDWSSDVCPSDLSRYVLFLILARRCLSIVLLPGKFILHLSRLRSEERRVGKEFIGWWRPAQV